LKQVHETTDANQNCSTKYIVLTWSPLNILFSNYLILQTFKISQLKYKNIREELGDIL